MECLRQRASRKLVTLVQQLTRERDHLLCVIPHCGDPLLASIVGAMLASTQPALAAHAHTIPALIDALLRAPSAGSTGLPSSWRECVFLGALRAASVEKSGAAGLAGFLRDAIGHIALAAGLTYRELLSKLHERSGSAGELALPEPQRTALWGLYQDLQAT